MRQYCGRWPESGAAVFFVTPYIFLVRTIFFNTGLFNQTLSTLSSKKGKKLKDLKNHNYISKFYNNC